MMRTSYDSLLGFVYIFVGMMIALYFAGSLLFQIAAIIFGCVLVDQGVRMAFGQSMMGYTSRIFFRSRF